MSRVRVADAAINREQQAFFSKYGISTTSCGGDAQNQVEEKQNNNNANNNRGFLCLKNVNLNGGERFCCLPLLLYDPCVEGKLTQGLKGNFFR